MHIQTRRNEIFQALQTVIGVVDRRQSLPVLANTLLVAEEDRLLVTATDLELQLQSEAQVQNLAPGRITAPARKLYDICRSLPEGAEISLETTAAKKLVVKSGRSRFTLGTMPAEEFPSFPSQQEEVRLELPAKELRSLLQRAQFAMAQQDVRYYLNGMLLDVNPQRIRTVATDGHRLAMGQMNIELPGVKPLQLILPRKTVLELQKSLEGGSEMATVLVSTGQVEVRLDGLRLSSKVIDGRFPDYERVIPDKPERRVYGRCEDVIAALSRAAILSNEKFRGVRLNVEKNLLRIQTQNPEQEEAEEEVEVEFDGSPLEIGFNVGYVLDALHAVTTERFVLELRGPDGSGLIREDGDSPNRYVVMPMRL
jgi:DNA polymerase-3 subunit beta